jgi:putative lipase involved disintegration of autophagic bodies
MEDARRIMCMHTGRELCRLLVEDGGWSADKHQARLAAARLKALVSAPERR